MLILKHLYMTEEQREKFKIFLKQTFDDVEFINVTKPEREWSVQDSRSNVKFTLEEMVIILQPGDIEEKMKKLKKIYPNRKRWTVMLKMGDVFPRFNVYIKKNNYKSVTKEIVRRFLEEEGII